MDRRKFIRSAATVGAVAVAGAANLDAGPRPGCPPIPGAPFPPTDAQGRRLIIPTDKPDRFNLKVMELNPIGAPDPEKWELEITGLVERPLKLRLKDLLELAAVTQSSGL